MFHVKLFENFTGEKFSFAHMMTQSQDTEECLISPEIYINGEYE